APSSWPMHATRITPTCTTPPSTCTAGIWGRSFRPTRPSRSWAGESRALEPAGWSSRMTGRAGRSLTLTHWGSYEAEVTGGRLRRRTPVCIVTDPSRIGAFDPAVLESPSRIRTPMLREGFLAGHGTSRRRRGEDAFVPVSWSEAYDLVAAELARVRDRHGN